MIIIVSIWFIVDNLLSLAENIFIFWPERRFFATDEYRISTNSHSTEDGMRFKAAFVTIAFLPFWACSLISTGFALEQDTSLAKKVDDYLTGIVPFGYSGGFLLAKNGEILLNKGYGMAVRDKGAPNTEQTIFCTGSVTKQFTAAGIMKLEMMGKLNTSDSITKYLPDVPTDKEGISLHNLLTHTSGIGGDVGGDYEVAERDETVKKILAQPLRAQPGKEFFYSNAGFSLLAAIIERVTGQSYEDFLRSQLFLPAGMANTGYRLPDWRNKVIAHWYIGDEDNGTSLDNHPFNFFINLKHFVKRNSAFITAVASGASDRPEKIYFSRFFRGESDRHHPFRRERHRLLAMAAQAPCQALIGYQ